MRFTYAADARPLEGYTLRRGIHRGGFGEVYYAVSDAGKEVALKLLTHDLETELRGIRQCLNLKHPNLVTIFDVRTDPQGDTWVVMEYVHGASLDDVLAAFPQGLPIPEVAAWMDGLTAGVGYLHERGLVHRDLKPANVYRENGQVKIGDVGLSKQMGGGRRGQHTEAIGTVYYMAPEVAKGQYGPEVDLYSLGVILFELTTGQLPFDGETTAEILMKHLTASPPLSGVPAALRSVVGGLLAKDPRERTPSVAALREQLSTAFAALPTLALPATVWPDAPTTGGIASVPNSAGVAVGGWRPPPLPPAVSVEERTPSDAAVALAEGDVPRRPAVSSPAVSSPGVRGGAEPSSPSSPSGRDTQRLHAETPARPRSVPVQPPPRSPATVPRRARASQRVERNPAFWRWLPVALIVLILAIPWSRMSANDAAEQAGILVFWVGLLCAVAWYTVPPLPETLRWSYWFPSSSDPSLALDSSQASRGEFEDSPWEAWARSVLVGGTLAGVMSFGFLLVTARDWHVANPFATAGAPAWLFYTTVAILGTVTLLSVLQGVQALRWNWPQPNWPMALVGAVFGTAMIGLGSFLQLDPWSGGRPMDADLLGLRLRGHVETLAWFFGLVWWWQGWPALVAKTRPARVDGWSLAWAGLLTWLVGGWLMMHQLPLLGWAMAISFAVQVAAPWRSPHAPALAGETR